MEFRIGAMIAMTSVTLLSGCAFIEELRLPKDSTVSNVKIAPKPSTGSTANPASQATKMINPVRTLPGR